MVRPPQRKPVRQDRTRRQHQQRKRPARQSFFIHPEPHNKNRQQAQHRRYPCPGQVERAFSIVERPQHRAQRVHGVVKGDGRVRQNAERIILKPVPPDHLSRMRANLPHAGHARITIGVHEIHPARPVEHLPPVRAVGSQRQQQRAREQPPSTEESPHVRPFPDGTTAPSLPRTVGWLRRWRFPCVGKAPAPRGRGESILPRRQICRRVVPR